VYPDPGRETILVIQKTRKKTRPPRFSRRKRDAQAHYQTQTASESDIEDRYSKKHRSSRSIRFGDIEPEHFDNSGARKTVLLAVNDHYRKLFVDFRRHFKGEMKEIDDASLYREVMILDKLVR